MQWNTGDLILLYIIFYGMPILIIWICLNFLLGIIGDAYTEVKESFQETQDFFSESARNLGFTALVRPRAFGEPGSLFGPRY